MIYHFLLLAVIIELTPGPNMLWLTLLGLSRGSRIALTAVIGITLGLMIVAAIATLGISSLIESKPWLFESLRIGGFLYLLFLAWDASHISSIISEQSFAGTSFRYLIQGVLTNLLNPKAYLVYIAVIPQFTHPGADIMRQLILLNAIYIIIATIVHCAVAALSGRFTAAITGNNIHTIGRIFSGLLVLVALWFLYSTKI